MVKDTVILRFSDVSFEYDHIRLLLDEVSFSVRTGSRITLMGQNGAGFRFSWRVRDGVHGSSMKNRGRIVALGVPSS